jgi:hypothetical protein
MANLFGQNIGTNYKGILNLNTLNGNLSGTLQAVTDGDGNASPLQLSTTQVAMLGDTFFGASSATTNILTLQSTTRNQIKVTNGSTFEIWQSAGVESARFDSNGNFALGTTAASARLHVRGDGTNPIARFESLTGTYFTSIEDWTFGTRIRMNGFSITENTSSMIYTTTNNGTGGVGDLPIHQFSAGTDNSTGSTSNLFTISRTIAPPTGSANFRLSNVIYTINASPAQTGTATGIFLNATETALNGMTHNLMDLQTTVSSVTTSQFRVSRDGQVYATNLVASGAGIFDGASLYRAVDTGSINIYNGGSATAGIEVYGSANATSFLRNKILAKTDFIALGAINDATAPAIKRNGAAIDFRLADDTGFCNVQASQFISNSFVGTTSGRMDFRGQYDISIAGGFTGGVGGVAISEGSNATPNASALLDVSSTTRGFLPPRMNDAQRTAITAPAVGLIVYQTDLAEGLYIYKSTGWTFVV